MVTERGGNPEELPCIKPERIFINGVDVGLVKRGSIEISDPDDKEALSVTFTLYPRNLTLRAI